MGMGMVANKGTLVCLCASAIICYASETHVYDHGSPLMFVSHIAIGAICFLTCVLQIILSEPFLNNALVTFLKSKKTFKNGLEIPYCPSCCYVVLSDDLMYRHFVME